MQIKWPRWLRALLIFGIVVLAAGLGFYSYRHATQPVTLTVASGALENDGTKMLSAIATRLASSQAPIRLKVIEKSPCRRRQKRFRPARSIWRSCAPISAICLPRAPWCC